MSLLTIVQNAASQLGLRQPQAVFGSTDLTAAILSRFAQQEGDELSRWHDWQAITAVQSFTSTATQVQATGIPTDFDRFAYNVEIWDRTNNQKFAGPTPQRTWSQLQSGTTGGIAGWWRMMGGELNIYPAPAAGSTIQFEYISKNWCESASAVGQALWMADTDVALLPERLFTLGVVWRFHASKGLRYAEDMATYEREKERAAARDRGTGISRPRGDDCNWPPYPTFSGTIDT